MPALKNLTNRFVTLLQRRTQRSEDVASRVLPPDFTGQIYLSAIKEGERVKARLAWLKTELERVGGELRAAHGREMAAVTTIPKYRVTGDALGDPADWKTVEDRPVCIKGPGVIKLQQKSAGLRRYEHALQLEISTRQTELSELRKIAELAGRGEKALICWMSDFWRNRLVIGGAVMAKLPKEARPSQGNVIFTDFAGYPLPPEALDADGKPDVPAAGRAKTEGA
jgi:hypothetical protein